MPIWGPFIKALLRQNARPLPWNRTKDFGYSMCFLPLFLSFALLLSSYNSEVGCTRREQEGAQKRPTPGRGIGDAGEILALCFGASFLGLTPVLVLWKAGLCKMHGDY